MEKIEQNMRRDTIAQEALRTLGWRVATVWECSIKGRRKQRFDTVIDSLETWLLDSQALTIELRESDIERVSVP